MRPTLALLACLAAGCDDTTPAEDDTGTPVATCDDDGDGYHATDCGGSDCDDTDPAVHPNIAETCNGIDDNCDGAVDEDALTTWYADTDGDGWGDPASAVEACESPGWLTIAGDCDDANPDVYPDAEEVCDGLDNDCDGLVDEGLYATFYQDADGDGYGDPEVSRQGCEMTPGWVEDGSDCDDTDAGVHPGVVETCDGRDEDCDGGSDDGVIGSSEACPAADCAEILALDPAAADGTYYLDLGLYPCDMTTDGGGWTEVAVEAVVYGTSWDTTYYNTEGITWGEVLFSYVDGKVSAHCSYPDSLTDCNDLGFQFDGEDWGLPLNWGSSLCDLATTDYTEATRYVGGYDFVVARAASTDTIRVGALEAVANCTTSDNWGTAHLAIRVRP